MGAPPTAPATALTVAIAGMLALAVVDLWREEIEDWATIALAVATVSALAYDGVSAAQWVAAALSAAVVFLAYLELGMRGVMGGGDVKLAAVPALTLGAVSPFLGVWAAAVAILLQQVLLRASTWRARPPAGGALPHVPAMAAALIAAAIVFGA